MVLVVKNTPAKAGNLRDIGWMSGSERSPGGGHGNPPQYHCLENPMDRGVWWSTVHRVANSRHNWGNLAAAAILFIERPDISTKKKKKKLLKLINELVKLEDTKLIYRNLLTFSLLLYSNYLGVSRKINQARQK